MQCGLRKQAGIIVGVDDLDRWFQLRLHLPHARAHERMVVGQKGFHVCASCMARF